MVLLTLVVNTIPSLTVHLYRAIVGKTTTQQVRAAGGLAWGGLCLLPALVPGPGQGAAGDEKGNFPQGSHRLDCGGWRCHLSLVALLTWWSLMTLGSKSGSSVLSPDWFMDQHEVLGQETCSSSLLCFWLLLEDQASRSPWTCHFGGLGSRAHLAFVELTLVWAVGYIFLVAKRGPDESRG